jgi:pimeloyl-ACP methyl ester carboxylesterase
MKILNIDVTQVITDKTNQIISLFDRLGVSLQYHHLSQLQKARIGAGVVVAAGILYHLLTIKAKRRALQREYMVLQRADQVVGQEVLIDDFGHSVFVRSKVMHDSDVTVVFVHGCGCNSLVWANVLPDIEKHASVCTIDRVIMCNVDTKNTTRDAPTLAREMSIALAKMNIKKPYVIVGHSYGGVVALTYTTMFPDDVKGLVLLDPAHPEQYNKLPRDMVFSFTLAPYICNVFKWLSPFGICRFLSSTIGLSFPPSKLYPKKERHELSIAMSNPKVWEHVNKELEGCNSYFPTFLARFPVVQQTIKDLPLVVITATHRIHMPSFSHKQATAAFTEMHAQYASFSSHGQQLFATKSDHWLHVQEPQIVVEAILSTLKKLK